MLWAVDSFFFALFYENIIMLLAGFASRVHFMLIASCYVAYFMSILGRPLFSMRKKYDWTEVIIDVCTNELKHSDFTIDKVSHGSLQGVY